MRPWAWLIALSVPLTAACTDLRLEDVPEAVAGCEAPTNADLVETAAMLPGRRCLACHKQDGQAEKFSWRAAGTVYKSLMSPCNQEGVEGVQVDIADENRKILVTLFTNRRGNFYTSEPLKYQRLIVQLSKDGVSRRMETQPETGDCASCHNPKGLAGGRIYFP